MCGIKKYKSNSAPFLKARAFSYLCKVLYGLDYILPPGQPQLCFGVLSCLGCFHFRSLQNLLFL